MIDQGNPEEIRDAIADHAYRRIQIFYYQSLAYYQTQCDIFLGRTEIQYGTANFPWAQAAHSSLLTHLLDNKLGLIHPKSGLYAAMNSTVELPKEVNQFDNILERNLRKKALEILNSVSKDGLHPGTATQKLIEEIWAFFQNSMNETQKKIELMKKMEGLAQTIRFLERGLQEENVKLYLDFIREIYVDNKNLKMMKGLSIQQKSGFSLEWRLGLLTMKKKTNRRILNRVKKRASAKKELPAVYQGEYLKRLEDSLEIIGIQWNNTRIPPFAIASLSKPLEDLLNEQLQIIKRD